MRRSNAKWSQRNRAGIKIASPSGHSPPFRLLRARFLLSLTRDFFVAKSLRRLGMVGFDPNGSLEPFRLMPMAVRLVPLSVG